MRRSPPVAVLASVLLLVPPAFAGDDTPADRALRWLVEHSKEEPREGPVILANASGKRAAALAVTAFLLALHPEQVEFRGTARRIEEELAAYVRTGGGISQRTWVLGFASLWLAEKGLRGDPDPELLGSLVDCLLSDRNREGGWAHGLNLNISFYPTTLMAATSWSLLALGLARRVGIEIDDEDLALSLSMLRRVQGETGAFPYGGPDYRKGYEAGRTTGAVAALAALGESDTEVFRKAARYVLDDPDAVPHGHASAAMHVLTGALAFRLLGDDAWARYDRAVLSEVRRRQKEDGSFACLLPNCPDCFSFMGGEELNALYITACYAAALSMPRSKVAEALRRPLERAEPGSMPEPAGLNEAWSVEEPGVRRLVYAAGRLCALASRDRLVSFDAKTGARIFDSGPAPVEGRELAWVVPAGDRLVAWYRAVPPGLEQALLSSTPLDLLRRRSRKARETMVCRSLMDGSLLWSAEYSGMSSGRAVGAGRVHLQIRQGPLLAFDLADGDQVLSAEVESAVVNSALAAAGDGRIAVAAESRLQVLRPDGAGAWSRRSPKRRRINPPAFGAALWTGGKLCAGRSDGVVVLYDGEEGELLWELELRAGVSHLAEVHGSGRVLALDHEGTLHCIRLEDGSVAWSFSPPRAREDARPLPPLVTRDAVLLLRLADDVAVVLSQDEGSVRRIVALGGAGAVAAGDGRIYLAREGRIRACSLK